VSELNPPHEDLAAPQLEKADHELSRALTSFHRLRWASLGVLAAVLIMAIVVGGVVILHQSDQISQARNQLVAGCRFFADLASLPVTPVPPVKRPTRLGVSIVVDSRIAAVGLGCSNIPPPSASLKKWAGYYHITLP